MSNPASLKPFKKGEDSRRNVKGRPPSPPDLKELIMQEVGEEGLAKIVRAAEARALKGDTRAIDLLFNRLYGQPRQQLEHKVEMEPLQPIINIIQGNAPPQAKDEIENV